MNDEHAQHVREEVDLEAHAKASHGQPAPRAQRYRIRIDKTIVTVDKPVLTGREILALVQKAPEQYKLYEHVRGKQPRPVGPEDTVDLQQPGLERFTTMPRDTTEGLEPPTLGREFVLPAQDEDYLSTLGRPWETIKDRNTLWLLIHEWEVPLGYSSRSTTIALLIPPGYADTQLDMVYFQPALTRQDGKPIGAISTHRIRETEFQRWSRHRTGANPWRPGVDDIAAHLSLVDEWLRREVA